jgi:RNA recognition motif-containing protein
LALKCNVLIELIDQKIWHSYLLVMKIQKISFNVNTGRLHPDTTTRELEDLFSKSGEISRCEVKKGRGFGFVEFKDKRDSEDAINTLQGTSLLGQKIVIELAKGSRKGGTVLFILGSLLFCKISTILVE